MTWVVPKTLRNNFKFTVAKIVINLQKITARRLGRGKRGAASCYKSASGVGRPRYGP